MTSLVRPTVVENLNQLQLLHFLSESNKILYMYKASSDKPENVKNAEKNVKNGNNLSSRLLQGKKNNSLNYSALVG